MNNLPTVPLVLDPRTFQRYYEKIQGRQVDDPIVSTAATAAAEARALCEQATAVYQAVMADESKPLAARLIQAKKSSGRLVEAAAAKLDAATSKTAADIERWAAETAAPKMSGLAPEMAQDAEMRSVLREATPEKRSEMFATGGDAVWRAALHAAPELIGLTQAEQEARRLQFRKTRYPDVFRRLVRLENCGNDLRQAGRALEQFAADLYAPALKVEAAAALAAEAIKASEATQ